MASSRRPEEQAPPDIFYNETEASKYLHNSRMIEIQAAMAERALEMLCLPAEQPCLLLDVGCGTGLSGETLEEEGHTWIGCDISADMLRVAKVREVEGDLLHQDMGAGLPFRQGAFDGAISISALQWLCYSDKTCDDPRKRLTAFFQSLYKVLRRGARAVLQFYPKDATQLQLITAAAMRGGFGGGLVVDYPHSTKAKKYFLVLLAGPPDPSFSLPQAKGMNDAMSTAGTEVSNVARQNHARRHPPSRGKAGHAIVKSREWVQRKKETQRKRGSEVRPDSKYTGRRRSKVRF
eukprot:CAMPEP_0183354326 /NCGR_PEP_ID=MMETSP0164_2-20130417/37242_1 /TAXON_ID=221442 /ORGANISM="Coccolithus pelagicus ssp braarudi, Strain PLY182g" /LENGTH=291 /DNA_ID=CAMNT_0025527185 /DNA_START=51 /DNA_END=926 /DNA_ORIENTATION=+